MTTAQRALVLLSLAGISMTLVAQPNVDRTVRPSPLPTPRINLPAIQKTTLSNGLALWVVEDRELPVFAVNLVILGGSDRDPASLPGLASMTADVLDEGTSSRDALAIADELEFVGSSLRVASGVDASFVSLNGLTKHLDASLAVFADVLLNPVFPQKEVDRLLKQRKTALLQQKDRAATVASLAFNRIIFGGEHPYGQDASGTEQSLTAMTRDDLVRFYTTWYRPTNATVIVVGDVRLTEIAAKLEKALAGWKKAEVPSTTFPSVPVVEKRRVYLIDKPGAPQAEIRIGYPAAARSTPDFFPLIVANRVLGGQFTSRLNLNLREKRGYTYGARSSFSFNRQPGAFTAAAGVVTAKADSALHEFLYEIDRMHAEGVTEEELMFVKKGLAGGFPAGFETAGQVAGALQNLVLYSLPDDYYSTYLQNIDGVSLKDVRDVCARYLDSRRMAVVVVGDMSVNRAGIEAMNVGPTVMTDVEGNPVKQ
jgi:predicted Zn-dependent peptidase